MFALYDDQRRHLLRLGLLLAAGATAVLPFTFSPTSPIASAESVQPTHQEVIPVAPGRMEFPEISVMRDPFVPGQALLAGKGQLSKPTSSLPLLRAVVTGDQPRALVEASGAVQVLAIGDKIGADAITAIDAEGVTLSSGIRLVITSQ